MFDLAITCFTHCRKKFKKFVFLASPKTRVVTVVVSGHDDCGVPPGVPETCVNTKFLSCVEDTRASRKGPLDGARDPPSFSVGMVDPAHSSRDVPVNLTLEFTRRESLSVIKGGTCRCCQTVSNVRL